MSLTESAAMSSDEVVVVPPRLALRRQRDPQGTFQHRLRRRQRREAAQILELVPPARRTTRYRCPDGSYCTMSSHSCVPSRSLNSPPDAPQLEPVVQRRGESAPHELAHVRVAEQSRRRHGHAGWPASGTPTSSCTRRCARAGALHSAESAHASTVARARLRHARSAAARAGRRSAAPSAPTTPSRRRRPEGRSRAPRRCPCGTTRVRADRVVRR